MRHSNRGRRKSGKAFDDKTKYARMLAIPAAIVLVLLVVILVMDRKPAGDKAQGSSTSAEVTNASDISIENDTETGTDDGSVEPDNNEYHQDFSAYELQKDAYPQVNELISTYFQAKVDQDVQLLYKVFGKEEDDRLEERKQQLKDEAVYIEDYQDITCYTKAGMTDDSYVVYVTYDVKFRRVDTLAPGLMWCYVVKNDNGDYIIRENVVGDEADYVASQNQTEDVRLLSTQVNERLKQAVESDSLLAGIYKDLSNGAVVSTSEDEKNADSQVMIGDGADASSGTGEETTGADAAEGTTGETPAEGTEETQTEAVLRPNSESQKEQETQTTEAKPETDNQQVAESTQHDVQTPRNQQSDNEETSMRDADIQKILDQDSASLRELGSSKNKDKRQKTSLPQTGNQTDNRTTFVGLVITGLVTIITMLFWKQRRKE